jgi:hypothetical protein
MLAPARQVFLLLDKLSQLNCLYQRDIVPLEQYLPQLSTLLCLLFRSQLYLHSIINNKIHELVEALFKSIS